MELFSWYPDNLSGFRNCGGEHIVPDGFSRSIRPSAAVADLVEAIWDWDIPDSDAAAAFTIKVPDPVANSI
jgi:hypothetical protein